MTIPTRCRIFFVCINLFPIGGTSVRTLGFANVLAEQGSEVLIAYYQSDAQRYRQDTWKSIHKQVKLCQLAGCEYKRLRSFARPLYQVIVAAKYSTWVARVMRAFSDKVDIIYCANEMSVLGIVLGRIAGKPVVADLHASRHVELESKLARIVMKIVERHVCENVDSVVVPTKELKDLYVSWGIDPEKVHVVRNPIDTRQFRPRRSREEIRQRLGVSASETLVVFHGRLSNRYNMEALWKLYEVAAVIETYTDKVKFVVIGDCDKELVRARNFIYTGYVRDLPDYLNAADFAIVPVFSNSLGIRSRILQYFAIGIPVITTSAGITGIHFAQEKGAAIVHDNTRDIALAAIELTMSPKKLQQLKENCGKVMGEFAPEIIGRDLLRVIAATM